MAQLNKFEKYLIDEFYDDYREGLLSRRSFIRRVAFITGSMAAASTAMLAVGCQPIELPPPGAAMPEPETPTPAAAMEEASGAVPGAQSPLSVPEGDPAVISEMVTFDNNGDEVGAYLAQPAAEGVYPVVLVCHENRGLTPHIKDVARRFAKEGYVALAIDLLWRDGGTDVIDNDQRPGLLTGPGIDRHVSDFAAGLDYAQSLPNVDGERVAMTGYCFGGGVTWATVTELTAIKAAAPYYGPAPDLEKVPNITAAVLGVYAEEDERINAGIEPLREALDAAGATYEIKIYPGVNHAFHNDTGERYNEEQALQAWQDTLDWFAQYV
ncbi:MAG: dienelactone hydrolase family protein [Caldilineaceae bacterium]|nr:dienelactone hydrolase family protein [Caldilineaceae bacterium]